jgi:recombinational DNA repair ATPase RecF
MRNAQLFEFLREVPCQTFVTTTDPAHILVPGETGERRDFRVAGGEIDAEGDSMLH